MPDNENDPKQPHTPTPPQAQAASTSAPPPTSEPELEAEVPEEVQAAHEKMIKAEIDAGKSQARTTESLDKARADLAKAEAKAAGAASGQEDDFPGYYLKMWGGHKVLQCAYCPWDVITSSQFNYVDRMREHLNQAHPNRAQLVPLFDEYGNAIVPAETPEEEE